MRLARRGLLATGQARKTHRRETPAAGKDSVSMSEEEQGTVRTWGGRGYGFVAPSSGAADLFFNVRDWHGAGDPQPGEPVTFTRAIDRAGKPIAVSVRPAGLAP
jgi:cold shock CspA family protein